MTYQDPAPDNGAGVTTVAKEQAGQVGQTAAQAGGQVAETTKEQAQNVVGEAKQQARDLVGEARWQVRDQAGTQKSRAVDGLRTLANELSQMAAQSGQPGLASEVARQAADRAHGLADHLDRHEPADLLDQVRSYARRRPVVFLTGAAVAGVLAGRLTRNLASSGDDSSSGRRLTGPTTPALSTGTYDTGYAQSAYAEPGYGQSAYDQPGYSPSGYADPSLAVSPTPGYPAGSTETVGYDQPAGYEPEPGTAYDPETGSAYRPDGAPRDWRAP